VIRGAALGGLGLLAACSQAPAPALKDQASGNPLERAAIAAGLVQTSDGDASGVFAREGDRLCLLDTGRGAMRMGATIDYGDGQGCTASGTAVRAGDVLHVSLGPRGDCTFDAAYESDRIAFPGALPAACQRLCRGRASLAALDVERLSDSPAEATALADDGGRPLCGE